MSEKKPVGLSAQAQDLVSRVLREADDAEARKLAAVVAEREAKKSNAARSADDMIARGNARGAAMKRRKEK